jgi:hypothetical protein
MQSTDLRKHVATESGTKRRKSSELPEKRRQCGTGCSPNPGLFDMNVEPNYERILEFALTSAHAPGKAAPLHHAMPTAVEKLKIGVIELLGR